jgi:hypothetical protein
MDIHKPKPWHGVREFLKEYVIIVVGVLTALAAEQAVEWLHWREKVTQAEAAMLPEIRLNLLSSYERLALAPCQRQRLENLRDGLLRPGPAWKAAPVLQAQSADPAKSDLAMWAHGSIAAGGSAMAGVYRTPIRPWSEGAWSSAVASGVFDHMPRDRATAYSRLYRTFAWMREEQQDEGTAKARLAALAYDRTLTEAEKTEFLNTVGALNGVNLVMELNAAQLIMDADTSGLRIKASEAKAVLDDIATSPRASCYVRLKIPLAPG